MSLRQNRNYSLYPYSVNILLSKKRNNTNGGKKMFRKVFLSALLVITAFFLFIFIQYVYALHTVAAKTGREVRILKGKQIVLKSGCISCHSFVKRKRIDNIITLAGWGNKHLSIKQTEKAIRSCRMDPYCSQILKNRQVKYVAYYLNSLK